MLNVPNLITQDDIVLWTAAKTVDQQWMQHVADPEIVEDLLTGRWARQVRQSPTLRTAILARIAKEPPMVLLIVSAVQWVSPAQFRAIFLILVQQIGATGFAPMLEHLWMRASPAQRAALSVEDLTACTQAQAGDLRLFAITVLLPAMDARRRGQTVSGTVTAWGTQLRTGVQRLTEKLRPSKGRSA